MEISVRNEKNNTQQIVAFQGTKVSELLKQVKINPETVIVVRNNEVITESELLHDQDHLDLLSVISGG